MIFYGVIEEISQNGKGSKKKLYLAKESPDGRIDRMSHLWRVVKASVRDKQNHCEKLASCGPPDKP